MWDKIMQTQVRDEKMKSLHFLVQAQIYIISFDIYMYSGTPI